MEFSRYVNKLLDSAQKAQDTILEKIRPAALDLKAQIQARSPVDTGSYRRSWRYITIKKAKEVCLQFKNPVSYGEALNLGSAPGRDPWFWFQPENEGEKSRSKKLIYAEGRVWAGGRSPGGYVIGGVVKPLIDANSSRGRRNIGNITRATTEALKSVIIGQS